MYMRRIYAYITILCIGQTKRKKDANVEKGIMQKDYAISTIINTIGGQQKGLIIIIDR